ncbi:MAG: succinylglutamate desuccinylase/aspartoacylase family protein [Acidobacteriota bacterium]
MNNHFSLLARILLFIAIATTTVCAQDATFTLGSVTAKRGERAAGNLEIPAGVDEGTRLPFTIFHGAKPGPTLLLVAGVHGSEYAPIIALQQLLSQLDASKLSGTVILVHSANPPSFFKRTIYYSPVDGKNLNRSFPGKADGTLTERIAHTILTQLIPRADYVIDVHCGDGNEDLIPYLALYTHATTPERIAHVKDLALRFGIEHIKVISGRSADPNNSVYLTNAAQLAGKYVMAVECGGLARADEVSVTTITTGLQNVMRRLRMLPGQTTPIKNPVYVDRDETIRTPEAGIFYPLVARGQIVKKDALLGYVTNLHGQKVHEARAPFAGKVMFIVKTPPVSAGEPLVSIGSLQP